jgi:hypothetical protein
MVTACPSAIPTSKNLFSSLLANSSSPVPVCIAAVIAQMRLSFFAVCTSLLPNAEAKVCDDVSRDSPFFTLNSDTP